MIEKPVEEKTTIFREGIAFQKRWDWEARKLLLAQEVIDASDATPEEVEFLLGKSDIDPNPTRRINYFELRPGDESIIIPEDFDLNESLVPLIRRIPSPRQPIREDILDALLWRQEEQTREQIGTVSRQRGLISKVFMATPIAISASDLCWSEWEAIADIKDSNGELVLDSYPDHIPTYQRLIAAPVSPETPIFES